MSEKEIVVPTDEQLSALIVYGNTDPDLGIPVQTGVSDNVGSREYLKRLIIEWQRMLHSKEAQ